MTKKSRLIFGGSFEDERGRLDFINDFNAQEIKRVYFTTHPKTRTIRAWQGHTVESRWLFAYKEAFR